jgi:hypothetical protein
MLDKTLAMNTDPEYGPFQFGIADLLAVMTMVALLLGTSRLPPSFLHAIPMLAVLYVAKYRILTLRVRPRLALLLYFLVVAALWPYFQRCTYCLWPPGGNRLEKWIGGLMTAFTVPTAFFLRDVLFRKVPSWESYAARSLFETLILVPLWLVVWVFIEILIGWFKLPVFFQW